MDLLPFITSAAGYAMGGPTGALIGAQIGGGISANEARADVAAQANAFSASQYASRYQTQVKDMEVAGLNPMLAYMQSPGSSPTGQQYQVSNPYEGLAQSYSSAYNVKRTGENIEADTSLKGAQQLAQESMSRLNDAQVSQVEKSVEKMTAEIRNLDSDNQRILALVDNLKEERQNLIKQGYNLIEQGNMLRASVDKIRVEIPLLRTEQFLKEAQKVLTDAKSMLTIAETGKTSAVTSVIQHEAKLKGYDVSAAEKFENFGREYKQYKGIIDLALEIFRPRSGGITINK